MVQAALLNSGDTRVRLEMQARLQRARIES